MQHMQNINHKITNFRIGVRFGLLMLMTALAGCATQGDINTASIAQTPPVEKSASVSMLQDGREGFIITEVAGMDEAMRNNFQEAVAKLNIGAYKEAIALLEAVIAQSPEISAPYINLGIAYQQMGNLEEAEKQYLIALELFPGHPVACNQFGLLLRKTGRFDEARNIFELVLAEFPNYYPVHRNLGILCDLYLNDLESALEHYETYSQFVPDDDQVKLWIADLRMQLGLGE